MDRFRRGRKQEEELGRVLPVARSAAMRSGATGHEAEEVAQVTAFKLWRIWYTPHLQQALSRDRRRWEGYVRKTAQNVHFDLIRGHQRRLNREERATIQNVIGLDFNGHAVATNSASDIEACLARTLIGEEIKRLPMRQRQVAILVWIAGLTSGEVAETLGVQPQTVRKALNAAKATLRDRLSDVDDPDWPTG